MAFRGESKGTLDGLQGFVHRWHGLVKRVSHSECVSARDCEVQNSLHFRVEGRLEITGVFECEGHFALKNSTLRAHQMSQLVDKVSHQEVSYGAV